MIMCGSPRARSGWRIWWGSPCGLSRSRRWSARRPAASQGWDAAGRMGGGGLVGPSRRAHPPAPMVSAAAGRLERMGRHLIGLAELGPADFTAALMPVLMESASARIAELETLLVEHAEQPAF